MPSKSFRVVRDKDNGYKDFFRGLRELDGLRAKVGIQGVDASSPHPDGNGLTMVEVGTIHEFGAPEANIPQRSFLRSTADEGRSRYEDVLVKASRRLLKDPRSFNARAELFRLGERVRADVIDKIRSGIDPPLKNVSSKRRESELGATPLWDKGFLVASIRSVIE